MSDLALRDTTCWDCETPAGPFTPFHRWRWRSEGVWRLSVLCPACARRREFERLRDSASTTGVRGLASSLLADDERQLVLFGGLG